MRLIAGRLNQRITVQSRSTTVRDSFNVDTSTWTALGSYWAEVRALAGRELVVAQQRWSDARFKVTMRYLAGVTPKNRIVWGTRTLDVLDCEDPDSGKESLVLICREVV